MENLVKTSSQYVFAEKPPQSKARVNLKERQGEQDDVGWSWKRGKGTLDRFRETVQILKIFLEPAMFCHLAVLIYLCGEVRKKGCNCVCPFERKGNWISVNAFLYFNSKVCKRLPKKVPIGK